MPHVIPTADFFESAIAFKFLPAETQGLPQGEFKGYGAIFGNVDSHGDIIEPGAFADTLAERKAQGRGTPPMHVMHSFFGGDGLPAGKWKDVAEDSKGLRVHGKVSGMNTDTGKMHFARVADGAYGGLSIGYSVPEGGSRKPTAEEKARGAKRVLTKVDLHEISLVDEPSNAQAKFDEMKAARLRDERKEISTIGAEGAPPTDPQAALTRAAVSIRAAMALHAGCMLGGDAPDAGERADFLEHLQDAHEALTGQRTPDDMKSLPDKRKAEKALRDAGLSRSQARDVVDVGFKTLHGLRDAPGGQTTPPGDDDAAVKTARDALAFLL